MIEKLLGNPLFWKKKLLRWNVTEHHGTRRNATERHGTSWNETERHGTLRKRSFQEII